MNLNEYPHELTNGRESEEASFVFCLIKNPELFSDYLKLNTNDDVTLKTEDGLFYFSLGRQMYQHGFKTLDHVSIYTFLEDKPTLKDHFERLGGYKSVEELKSLVSTDNIDVYFDNIQKANMLMELYDKGFNVLDNLEKFKNMTCDNVYDYYDYMLNHIAINKTSKADVENLSEGYDKYVEEWNSGIDVGFKIGAPLLNHMLAGVHKENLLLHMAGIGQGKTTTSVALYVIPAIESGENVCIIANEQSVSQWREMLLSTVLFNKIKYPGMNRQKMITGGFSKEQREKIKEAQEWIANQKGKIIYCNMENYSITNVKKIVKKYSKVGYGLFIYDTLKPESDASDRAWGEFSEVAKELFLLAKSEKVAVIATAQLSSDSIYRKYLDLSCIGKSKAIAETASTVVMIRPLSVDEKESVKPYQFEKDTDGKWTKNRRPIDLDPNKRYIAVFVAKNRYGAVNPQIVMSHDMSFNSINEIGYWECPFERFSTK